MPKNNRYYVVYQRTKANKHDHNLYFVGCCFLTMLRRFVILFVINGALATPGWKGSERKLERDEDYYPPAHAPYDPTPVAKTAPA